MSNNNHHRVLVVEDDAAGREAIAEWLQRRGYDAITVANGEEAIAHIDDGVAVIVTDLKMPKVDGMELLRLAKEKTPYASVIMVSGRSSVEDTVAAIKEGAFDFLPKPLNLSELTHRIEMALEKRSMGAEIASLHAQLKEKHGLGGMIGESLAMREVFEKIQLVADTNSTVLIVGESGTGKELVARSVHELSRRSKGPFIPVNCAAIPETLVESELFGHEKGAFTGASDRRKGLFQSSEKGTLFIDEIGELPLNLQSKLLRAIENKTVMPVGSSKEIPVDARLVAATNRDLEEQVKEKQFREDLYYRLKVVVLRLPPLRERRDDIPILVRHFISSIAKEYERPVREITADALQVLLDYDWPGNVRELRNTLESVIVLSLKETIDVKDLPSHIRKAESNASQTVFQSGMTLEDMEREAIRRTLQMTNGHRAETAERLGVSVRTLQRKIKQFALESD